MLNAAWNTVRGQRDPVDPHPVAVELVPDDWRIRVDHRLGCEAFLSHGVGSSEEQDRPLAFPPSDACLSDEERSAPVERHIGTNSTGRVRASTTGVEPVRNCKAGC